ncbi:CPBP family intramembrane glutamic endopeptidase [Nonomuraea sp. M3C6]|uniref:CPBP family intramembrane glutamic endopeptidase n=1 Tax=Nonomuraea marmarensis TaxID=3351344 RepID=A0ABW7A8R2_9ACTN
MSSPAPLSTGPHDQAGPPRLTTPDGVESTGLRARIRRRPLTWFFVMAYVLSWAAWTPYVLSENGLGILPFGFPALLGTTQLLGVLPGAYLGPIFSAFVVTAMAQGRPGLRAWAGRLAKWRVSWRWYVAIIVGVPAVLTVALTTLGGTIPAVPSVAMLAAFLPGLILQMVTTGIAEEPGWRDFAMPLVQRRYGPLLGTLIVGPLWGAWHLPLFLTEWGGPHLTWEQPVEFIITAIAFSFVMTWVFNRTGESLPLAMLLHTGVNNFFSLAAAEMFPRLTQQDTTQAFLFASIAVALVVLIATRGRLGYRPAHSVDGALPEATD